MDKKDTMKKVVNVNDMRAIELNGDVDCSLYCMIAPTQTSELKRENDIVSTSKS